MISQVNICRDLHIIRKRIWLLPVLAGLVAHLPALFCGFVYDDVALVQEHPYLGSFSFLGEIWHRDYGLEFARENCGFYRPMFMTVIWLLRNVFGPDHLAFHLFSLAVFCLAIWLVVRVASAFDTCGTGLLPLVAGILYAVHPARVETVSLVMSLPDLLVECCGLGMVLTLLKTRHAREASARRTALACGAWSLFAVLTKESAFSIFPAVASTALVFACLRQSANRKLLLAAAGGVLAALLIGGLLRKLAQIHTPVGPVETLRNLLVGGRADDTLVTLLLALRDVVLPGPVVFWRNVAEMDFPGAVAGLLLIGGVIAGGWWAALRRGNLPLALLLAWLGANVVNLTMLFGASYDIYYSHRYLAFAPIAILLCLAVRIVAERAVRRWQVGLAAPRFTTLAVAAVVAYLTAFGVCSLTGAAICINPLTFFQAMRRANPADIIPLGAVAQTLEREGGRAEEIEKYVIEATLLDPKNTRTTRLHHMLIKHYLADRRYQDAFRCAKWSLGIYSNNAETVLLRATAVANLGRPDLAKWDVEQVLSQHPDFPMALQLREQLLRQMRAKTAPPTNVVAPSAGER